MGSSSFFPPLLQSGDGPHNSLLFALFVYPQLSHRDAHSNDVPDPDIEPQRHRQHDGDSDGKPNRNRLSVRHNQCHLDPNQDANRVLPSSSNYWREDRLMKK